MPTSFVAALDRLIAGVLLTQVRRTYPSLGLLPTSWLRPLLMPTARRMRRSLERRIAWLSLLVGATIVLLTLLR
jgi:hypothetical protein